MKSPPFMDLWDQKTARRVLTDLGGSLVRLFWKTTPFVFVRTREECWSYQWWPHPVLVFVVIVYRPSLSVMVPGGGFITNSFRDVEFRILLGDWRQNEETVCCLHPPSDVQGDYVMFDLLLPWCSSMRRLILWSSFKSFWSHQELLECL